MLRLICPRPNQFKLEDVPRPEIGAGQALVKIKRIGICGSDIHAFRGEQLFFSYPRVFGHELAGELILAQDGALDLAMGDPVVIDPYLSCGKCIACRSGRFNCCTALNLMGVHSDGGFQEYLAVPVGNLLPAGNLTWDQMALVECMAIGAHAVARAKPRRDEWALVIGMGPIGWGAVIFAQLAGQKVIAMEADRRRLERCRDHLSLDHAVLANDDAPAAIAEITEGEFVTAVYDATGNPTSMNAAINFMAHTGRLVFIGHHKGRLEIPDLEFHKRETSLLASRNATATDLRRVMAVMADGSLDIAPLITHRTTLKRLPAELEQWLQPNSGLLKGVIEL
jgi:2-desacetyl-2-hydroxyethyl bacteriochlorophyllide A dehydrogenase